MLPNRQSALPSKVHLHKYVCIFIKCHVYKTASKHSHLTFLKFKEIQMHGFSILQQGSCVGGQSFVTIVIITGRVLL